MCSVCARGCLYMTFQSGILLLTALFMCCYKQQQACNLSLSLERDEREVEGEGGRQGELSFMMET